MPLLRFKLWSFSKRFDMGHVSVDPLKVVSVVECLNQAASGADLVAVIQIEGGKEFTVEDEDRSVASEISIARVMAE